MKLVLLYLFLFLSCGCINVHMKPRATIVTVSNVSYLADSNNNRVILTVTRSNSTSYTVVLGQPDFTSNTANNGGISASSLNWPGGAYYDGEHFIVGDTSNNRVLIWNSLPTENQQPADIVLGQPDFTSDATTNGGAQIGMGCPYSTFSTGDKLAVADYCNNRVLIWNTFPTVSSEPADFSLGQPDMLTITLNTGGLSAQTLGNPNVGVTDDGTFLVLDYSNNRVLIWNSWPTVQAEAPDVVVGQPNMTSNGAGNTDTIMRRPWGGSIQGGKLFTTEYSNHRAMIWNTVPTVDGTAADVVLGQPNFTSNTADNGGISASTMQFPTCIFVRDGKLYVTDQGNHRVLIWNSIPTSTVGADDVLGQPNFTSETANNGGISATTIDAAYEYR